MISLEEKFVGAMLGLAVGDALGAHFEGQSTDWLAGRYANPEELILRPPEAPWHYTDDTQMAIGIAEALLIDNTIIEKTLCNTFVENYMPNRGYGRGARIILQAMEEGQDYKHWANEYFPGGSYGNGAAMRVAPVGLLFHSDLDACWEQAKQSSLPTHVHLLGIEGAQLTALAVALAVTADRFDKDEFFDQLKIRCDSDIFISKLSLASEARDRSDLIRLGNGISAQDSVVTAIACFSLWPSSFEQAVANAILLGGDTDTIAAMTGAISGAHLGAGSIPDHFLKCVENDHKGRDYIRELGHKLYIAFAKRDL